MLRRLAIKRILPIIGAIAFYTDKELVDDLVEFGTLSREDDGAYILKVDGRYNYEEVVGYIKSLEETLTLKEPVDVSEA